jgi:hypothetical protein
MKQTLSHSEATHMIYEVYDHQFSYAAANALAEYYEDLEEEMGEEIEIDPVAIACDWMECADRKELLDAYGYRIDADDDTNCLDEDEKLEALLDDLRDNTTVIELNSGEYIVQAF